MQQVGHHPFKLGQERPHIHGSRGGVRLQELEAQRRALEQQLPLPPGELLYAPRRRRAVDRRIAAVCQATSAAVILTPPLSDVVGTLPLGIAAGLSLAISRATA